jgi:hypothetical protein
MAEKLSYPQLPSTVWWGVRGILQRSPNATIDERALGVELAVQEVAARQYLTELKRVGILNDENKATPVAQKWRHDETYGEAVDEILKNAYPEGLIQIAPRGTADRQKVTSWFAREGLGTGTAGNKAATYLLIGSDVPNEPPPRGSAGLQRSSTRKVSQTTHAPAQPPSQLSSKSTENRAQSSLPTPMPLNINVQIHISAEASGEQIETIFAAMRRYLYDGNAN